MPESYDGNDLIHAFAVASKVLDERKEEINRLNVFPVPDGDTGTNISLTLESVVKNLATLPADADGAAYSKAIITGALMGARGNSGVIISQILRGICSGSLEFELVTPIAIELALANAVNVAFQAVRKPVEGTILTVLKDSAAAAKRARRKKLSINDILSSVVNEAYASVQRTPDLLPVLKENGVVDAGGYGLAIFFDAFFTALTGREESISTDPLTMEGVSPKVEIEQVDDWENSEYRYCTEFLVHSDSLDVAAAKNFLPTMGDCDLFVGIHPSFKAHVHSNRPDKVLAWFLDHDAQISEVHVHNMDLQSAERNEKLVAEREANRKPLGFVAVGSGEGTISILESLGIDYVVEGGQTMNPSTKDLLDAVDQVNADSVIILPNNDNIILAAQSACELAERPCAVVPTKSVPESFAALFAVDPEAELNENVTTMIEALDEVHTGEVTTAIKDAKDSTGNPIHEGDVIGLVDGSIEVIGSAVEDVTMEVLSALEADDADELTILAGEELDDEAFELLINRIETEFDDLEVQAHRGDQPLYPIVLSVE